jgi:hypothetical protein
VSVVSGVGVADSRVVSGMRTPSGGEMANPEF